MTDLVPVSLGEALERNAAAAPRRVAVICSTGWHDYAELNAQTNALANAWLNSDAKPEQIVCSFLPKGLPLRFVSLQRRRQVWFSLR